MRQISAHRSQAQFRYAFSPLPDRVPARPGVTSCKSGPYVPNLTLYQRRSLFGAAQLHSGYHAPMQRPTTSTDDPLWYQDAVIYEIHVRAFYDENGDGMGDFAGLTQKLDYLQDLGVTALWL